MEPKLLFNFFIFFTLLLFGGGRLLAVSDTVWYSRDNLDIEFMQLALSPNGQYIALAFISRNAGDTNVRNPEIIRTSDGQIVKELIGNHKKEGVYNVSFLNDSIVGTNGRIMNIDSTFSAAVILWNINTGDTVKSITFKDTSSIIYDGISKIEFSRDGKYLFCELTTSDYYYDFVHHVRVNYANKFIKYDVQNQQIARQDTITRWWSISPASNYYTYGFKIYDIDNDTLITPFPTISGPTLSNDGRYIAGTNGKDSLFIWDYVQRAIVKSISTNNDSNQIGLLTFSPNSNFIIVSGYRKISLKGFNYIIKIIDDSLIYDYGEEFYPTSYLKVTPDSQYIVAANSNNEIFVIGTHWTLPTLVKEEGNGNELIYPNPTNGNVHLNIDLEKPSITQITIFDEKGNIYKEINNIYLNNGTNNIDFTTEEFPNGYYFTQIKNKYFSSTFKLIINK